MCGHDPSYVACINVIAKLDPAKFKDPLTTADGQARAHVTPHILKTLWFNTGTLCNLTCANCYIESSPSNDQLVWLTRDDVIPYLDEIATHKLGTTEIGFTGGEPFMNPQIAVLLAEVLERGFHALVLTNAMTPLRHHRDALLQLKQQFGTRLTVRVSDFESHGRSACRRERLRTDEDRLCAEG